MAGSTINAFLTDLAVRRKTRGKTPIRLTGTRALTEDPRNASLARSCGVSKQKGGEMELCRTSLMHKKMTRISRWCAGLVLVGGVQGACASTHSLASSSAPASHECIHRNEAVTDSLGRAIVNATGVILIDSATTTPRIDVGGEPCLVLPPEYAAAVAAHDPAFKPWNTRPFPTWIFTDETVTARQTPFAVIGDLTGNGGADVVIDGHSDGYASRLILLRNGNEVRVVKHYRRPLPVVASVYREGFSEAIHLVPPGRYESFFEEEALELENFAFEWLFLEKAAVIVYWRGGEFQEWTSAD